MGAQVRLYIISQLDGYASEFAIHAGEAWMMCTVLIIPNTEAMPIRLAKKAIAASGWISFREQICKISHSYYFCAH
jgi:hypothetical protein